MEIKVQETKKACESKVLCAATEEEWTEAKDQALKELARNVTVKGFRKGKAPLAQAAKYINNSALLDRAGNKLVSKAYEKIVNEEKIIPVMQPSVEVKEFSDKKFTVEFTIITSPVVELGEYKGLEIKKNEVNLTEEDVQKELESLRERSAEMVVVEDDVAAKDGDLVVIDFVGYIDDVAFEGGSAENYELTLGSKVFIPGFEDQLIGVKKGENKDVNVTFPENYVEPLVGKAATFKVKVNEIKTKVLPELNDDFAKECDFDDVDNLEQLKEHAKKELQERREKEAENKQQNDLVNKVVSNAKFTIHEKLLNDDANAVFEDFKRQVQSQGLEMDDYYKVTNTKEEDVRKQARDQALANDKRAYVISQIAKEEKLLVSNEEIEQEYQNIADAYGMDVNVVKKELESRRNELISSIVNRKVLEFLKANNNL